MGEIINFSNISRKRELSNSIPKDKNSFFETETNDKYDYDIINQIFIKYSNDYQFLDSVLEDLDKKIDEEWVLEFKIKLFRIIQQKIINGEPDIHKLKRYSNALQYSIELEIYDYMMQIDDSIEENEKDEIGMGFYFIENNFCYSTDIKDYFAEMFIDKIISNYSLEEYIHSNYKSFVELENKGINTVIAKFISSYDKFLAVYIINHKSVLRNIKRKINNIKENWDSYVSKNKYALYKQKIKKQV